MLPDNILFSTDPGKDLKEFVTTKEVQQDWCAGRRKYLQTLLPIDQAALARSLHDQRQKVVRRKKIWRLVHAIWQAMTDNTMDRHACLIVLGGGVLGDMGGFCASTYKRGIDFVLVPTTLLAQADASIGGKLGIDFNHYKNHIGVFQHPALTFLHSGFLKTLPAGGITVRVCGNNQTCPDCRQSPLGRNLGKNP